VAIKEFNIGQQNYFQENYFLGDYTLSNVSRAFLQCDVDNVKGGRVVTGEYYVDNYIDGTYYHDNTLRSSLSCEALVVQVAVISLSGYYQDGYFTTGYFTPSTGGKFTLICVTGIDHFGVAALSASASASIVVGKIAQANVALTVTVNQSATISHIEGADLFALSDAQLAVAVARLRNSNTAATSTFNIATDFVRTLTGSGEIASQFATSQSAINLRGFDSQQSAAFSLAASVVKTVDITRTLSSQFSQTSSVGTVKSASSTVSAEFTQTSTIDGVLQAQSALTAAATVTATTTRFRSADSTLASTGTVYCLAINLQGYDIVATNFASMSIEAVKTVDIARTLSSQFSQSVSGNYALAGGQITVSTVGQLFAYPVISVRNTVITNQSGSGYTHTATIDTGTKKFGAGALAWTATNESEIYPGKASTDHSRIVWDGTNYKTYDAGYVWTSTNGQSWSRSTHNLPLPLNNNITYANGYYFYVRGNNTAYYSSDSTTWTQLTGLPTFASTANISDIYYQSGFYYILHREISNGGIIRYRADTPTDNNWSTPAGSQVTILNATVASMSELYFSDGAVVFACVVGANSRVQRYNGTTLTNIGTTSLTTQTITSVAWDGNNTYVAFGDNTVFYTTNSGTNWSSYSLQGSTYYNQVKYISGNWYISTSFGLYKGSNPASLTFVSANTSIPTYGNQFVALDLYDLGKSKTSADGTTWSTYNIASVSGLPARLRWSRGDGSDLGNWKTIDFWAYSSFSDYVEILHGSQGQRLQLYTDGDFTVYQTTPSSTFSVGSGSFENISTGWHHYRLSRDGTTIAYYVDGVRKVYSASFPNEFYSAEVTLTPRVYIFQVDEVLISDELKTAPGETSFTAPTVRWSNDANTDLLLHFDTDFADDSRDPVDPSAALTSTASIQARLTGPQRVSADLAVTATLTAAGGKINEINLVAFSNAAVSATVDKFRPFASALTTQVSQATVAAKTTAASIAVSGQFDQSLNGNVTAFGSSSISSLTSVSVSAERFRSTSVSVSSSASVQVTAVKTQGFASAMSSSASVDATALRIFDFNTAFTAIASEVAVAYRVADYFVNCDCVATVTCQLVKTVNIYSPIVAVVAVSVVGTKTTDYQSNLNSAASLTAPIELLKSASSSLAGSFNTTATTSNLIAGQAGLASSSTVTVEVSVFEGTAVLYLVNTTLTVAFDRIRSSTTGLTTTASINAQSAKTANITSNLTANSTLNCTISHILGADIVAGNFATLTASGDSVKEMECQLLVTVSVTATGQITRQLTAVFNTAVVSSVSAKAIFDSNTQAQVAFGLTGTGNGRINFVAASSMATTLTCTISHIEGANIVANNFATVSAGIRKFAGAGSQLTSQFSVSANTQEIQNVSAGLTTAFSLTVTALVFSDFTANLQSTSTVTAGITAFVGVIVNLQVTGFILAEGKEIRLDNIVYVIPPESRLHTITSETRLYKVGSETRIYKLRRA
jgi:hypothetical protein